MQNRHTHTIRSCLHRSISYPKPYISDVMSNVINIRDSLITRTNEEEVIGIYYMRLLTEGVDRTRQMGLSFIGLENRGFSCQVVPVAGCSSCASYYISVSRILELPIRQ